MKNRTDLVLERIISRVFQKLKPDEQKCLIFFQLANPMKKLQLR